MSFLSPNQESERVFSNADSFAMAFDTAWKEFKPENERSEVSQDEKLRMVLLRVKDHPFCRDFPSKAEEVAKFRIRLLKLL